MSKNNNTKGVSVGFLGLLTLLFITLKLTNQIDWNWYYITMPLWILPAIGVSILILWVFIGLLFPRTPYKKYKYKDGVRISKDDKHIPKKSRFQEKLEEMANEKDVNYKSKKEKS